MGKRAESSRKEAETAAIPRISLLEPLSLQLDGYVVEEDRFPGRQARLLFAYLALEHRRPVPRDELADVLWGDTPPPTWEKALTGLVGKLRALLAKGGEVAITSAFGCYQLRLPEKSWVDVEAAGAALEAADRAFSAGDLAEAQRQGEEAAALARRSFLPGETASWVESKRRELGDVLLRALDRLTDTCLAAGRGEEAVAWAKEAVEREPLREAGYQRLMRAYTAADNQAEALLTYERCRRLLADELGAHPSSATQALHTEILRGDGAGAGAREVHDPTVPESAPLARRRRLRPRFVAAIAVCAGVIGGATAAGIELTGAGDRSRDEPNAVAAVEAGTGRVRSYTEVGASPSTVAVGEGGVWVIDADGRTVSRIDPSTREKTKTFAVRGTPTDLAVGAGAVWVGTGAATPTGTIGKNYTANVSRVDPQSALVTRRAALEGPLVELPTTTYEPPRLPGVAQLAVGAGGVWAINPDRTVSRIDPATGRVVARIRVVATHAIAAGREGVWVVGRGPTLTRIDPIGNRAGQTIRLEATGLAGIAVGGGSVWATDPTDGLVWRVEPGRNPVARSIDAGVGVTSIAFADGTVWTTDFIGGRLLKIDPRKNVVVARIPLASTPAGVAAGNGFVWVSVAGGTRSNTLPSSTCGNLVAGGGAHPDVVIASDLPLRGPQGDVTHAMADAIGFELHKHGFRAGRFTVGYQSCDDSTAQTGNDDLFTCAANAKAYAETASVVAVIGPYNSSCAEVEIPITNRADGGPLAMISPANTRQGLTRAGPGVERGAPGYHYPSAVRSYVRLAAPDDVYAGAAALLAKQLHLGALFVLTTGETMYGVQLTSGVVTAARKLGLGLAGSGTWNPKAGSYAALANRVARSGADGVFLADFGLNGGMLIRALRSRLGNRVTLIASDGFLPVSAILNEAGAAAVGTYLIFPVAATETLGATGRRFVREFGVTQPNGVVQSGTYVPEAAAAADLVLDAISRSDGTRASVLRELQHAHVRDGILGSFRFDENGDMDPALVSAFRITGRTTPRATLVRDFRGSTPERLIKVPVALVPR